MRRRSLALVLFLVPVLAGSAAGLADACVCMPLPMPYRFTHAAEVFAGRILESRFSHGSDVLRVRIEQAFKGTRQSGAVVSIAVRRSHTAPVSKRIGQRWVFFAYRDTSRSTRPRPNPLLVSSDCAGNERLAPNQPLPDLLTWNGPNLPDPSVWIVPGVIAASRP
jgi:hypothetical protein